jgi:hypothetical protein
MLDWLALNHKLSSRRQIDLRGIRLHPSPAVRSGKSREPDTTLPANLAFRLQHLFGPGSRAEVMRVLLTYSDGSLDASRISDESAFAKRNTSETLNSLAASGTIKANWRRNERHTRPAARSRAARSSREELVHSTVGALAG